MHKYSLFSTPSPAFMHCYWECKVIQPLWKTVWRFFKKLGIKPPYDPAIPLVGIYPDETKIEKDTCIPLFTAALFTITRTWNQPRCPLTDEWYSSVYMYHNFLIHSYTDGHLGCFRVLTVVNSTAMNIGVRVSFSSRVSSGCMPSSGIAGLHGSFISSFS